MRSILLAWSLFSVPALAEVMSGSELQLVCESRAVEQRKLAKHDHGKYTVEKVREDCLALAARRDLSFEKDALAICQSLRAQLPGSSEPDYAQIRDFVPCAKAAAGPKISTTTLSRCWNEATPLARSRCLQESRSASERN